MSIELMDFLLNSDGRTWVGVEMLSHLKILLIIILIIYIKALYEFQIIDFICNAFFTVELLTRFLTCPSKKVFVRRLPIIIDLIALISFYADLTIFILGVSVSTFT